MSAVIKDIYEAFNINDTNKANVNKFFAIVTSLDVQNTKKCIELFKEYKLFITKMSELKIFLYDAEELRVKVKFAKEHNMFVELMNNINILHESQRFEKIANVTFDDVVVINSSKTIVTPEFIINIDLINDILSKPQTSVFTPDTYEVYDKLLEVSSKVINNLNFSKIATNSLFEKNLQKLVISGIKYENEILYHAITHGLEISDTEKNIIFNTIVGVL